MINKRLLVKALLSHNDENSFYDKKLKLNLVSKAEKAKFLKHICALSNANPHNNSFIVIGIEDQSNSIVGVDFFDDSKIQILINAYLKHSVPAFTPGKSRGTGDHSAHGKSHFFSQKHQQISARNGVYTRGQYFQAPCF